MHLNELLEKHRNNHLLFRHKSQISRKRVRSDVWNNFQTIYDISTNREIYVKNFVYCVKCRCFQKYNGVTTSKLLSHQCGDTTNNRQITQFVKKPTNTKINFSSSDIKQIRDAATKFIVNDMRPFYAVQGCGLLTLLNAAMDLVRRYPQISQKNLAAIMPTRNTMVKHIGAEAQTMCKKIQNEFSKALEYPGCFAATADLWKDSYKSITYLGLVAHLCTIEESKIIRKSIVFHASEVTEIVKSNRALYQHKVTVFDNYNLKECQVNKKVKWVTDRGDNVKIAFSKNGSIRFDCFAHVVNNIVEHICKTDKAKKIISSASSLVTYMKRSGLNSKLDKTLVSYSETRWNTVYYTLKSISESYENVLNLLNAKEAALREFIYAKKITCMEISVLNEMIEFLKLFTVITIDIEGEEKPTMYKVWPYLCKIKNYLQDSSDDSQLIAEMKSGGRKYIEAQENKFKLHIQQKVICFLHPLLKSLSFASLSEVIEVQSRAEEMIKEEFQASNTFPNPQINEETTRRKSQKFDSILNEFVQESLGANESPSNYSNEFQNYLSFNMKVRSSLSY